MRRITPLKKKRALLRPILGFVLLFCLGITAFLISPYGRPTVSALKKSYQAITDRAHLVLTQVQVEGHIRTSLTDINKTIGLTQGMPIFDIDLKTVQNQLKELPWIKSVILERHLPSTLFIRITEKEPIAVWQNNRKYLPLDTDGQPIQDTQTHLPHLILVVGEDAPAHTPDLLKALEDYPEIREKVRSAVRVGGRRWNLILNEVDGLIVKLPELDIAVALDRLQQAADQDKLLKKDLSMIDLRQPDRLIVRLKEGK